MHLCNGVKNSMQSQEKIIIINKLLSSFKEEIIYVCRSVFALGRIKVDMRYLDIGQDIFSPSPNKNEIKQLS